MAAKEKIQVYTVLKKLGLAGRFRSVKALLSRALGVTLINAAGALLLFFINVWAVKLIGDEAYGKYSIISVWANLLAVVIVFGFDDMFIAIIPKLPLKSQSGIPAILWKAFRIALIVFASLAVVTLTLSQFHLLPATINEYKGVFLAWAGLLAFLSLLLAFYRSINIIAGSQAIDKLIRPILMVLFLAFVISLASPTLNLFIWCQLIAVAMVCLALLTGIIKKMGAHTLVHEHPNSGYRSNLAFLGITLLNLLSTRLDLLVLAQFAPAAEVGYYNIAARLADFAGYPLAAINLIVHTRISSEYQESPGTIRKAVMKYCGIAFATILVVLLLLLVAGKPILRIFGEQFLVSYIPLMILASSYLLNAFSQPFNALLMVSNRERWSLIALGINVAVTFLAARFLIPRYGSLGAAWSIVCGSMAYLIVIGIVISNIRFTRLLEAPEKS